MKRRIRELDFRVQEDGWGERRLEREAGTRPHRKTDLCLEWRCRGRRVLGTLLVAKAPLANLPIRKSRGGGAGEEGGGGENVSFQCGKGTVLTAHMRSHRSRNTRWDPEGTGRNLNPTSRKPRGRLVVILGL